MLAFLSIALLSLIGTSSCTSRVFHTETTEKNEEAEEDDFGNVSDSTWKYWIRQEMSALIVERTIKEDPEGEIFKEISWSNMAYDSSNLLEALLVSDVLTEEDGSYEFNNDKYDWNGGNYDVAYAIFETSQYHLEVSWCGSSIRGDEYIEEYIDRNFHKYNSKEEYLKSIERYVNCQEN
ncbi:hypothetical protein ACIQFP_00620 [Nocardiopsis alba]|uniref:hypothetical protein n=1 Tax=Nocardiopsis alba TaxID=53437 RepID=UPI0037F1C155